MVRVENKKNDTSLDDLLRQFKRAVKQSGVLQECGKREYFRNRNDIIKFKQKKKKKQK